MGKKNVRMRFRVFFSGFSMKGKGCSFFKKKHTGFKYFLAIQRILKYMLVG